MEVNHNREFLGFLWCDCLRNVDSGPYSSFWIDLCIPAGYAVDEIGWRRETDGATNNSSVRFDEQASRKQLFVALFFLVCSGCWIWCGTHGCSMFNFSTHSCQHLQLQYPQKKTCKHARTNVLLLRIGWGTHHNTNQKPSYHWHLNFLMSFLIYVATTTLTHKLVLPCSHSTRHDK